MILALCVDEYGGLLFNNRRLSKDASLIDDFLCLVNGQDVFVDSYSKPLFPEGNINIKLLQCIDDLVADDAFYFFERGDLLQIKDLVTKVILYRWNRHYPSDIKFSFDVLGGNFKLINKCEFKGSSHDCITREIYEL